MALMNCWEYKSCGREPDGTRVDELGVCPASVSMKSDGINRGTNGGRACWAIAGTLCNGEVQGTFAAKLPDCMGCTFYETVRREENSNFKNAREIFAVIA